MRWCVVDLLVGSSARTPRRKKEQSPQYAISLHCALSPSHPLPSNRMLTCAIPMTAHTSKADCFHPSAEGQALFARGMWENLQQPVGSKENKVDPKDPPVCPTNDTRVGV